ncbi:MAG: stage II sporulation protein P [Beduini sp.]|uniref:stage II sporulation protein P n=1 Tax=Beduini sp. TaxID=1922300 RepID=UPI00399F808A
MRRNSGFYILGKFLIFSVCLFALNMCVTNLLNNNVRVDALEKQDSKVVSDLESQMVKLNQNQGVNKSIYIYSTHQQEKYADQGVFEGSKYLAEKLRTMGYNVIVEESNFENYAAANGMQYDEFYQVSNTFLTEALVNNGGFDLVIDFHRDSVGANVTRLLANDKAYAKMMFVIGGLSEKVEAVRGASQALSTLIDSYMPGISRGTFEREAYYNQYVTDHMLLIEVGGVENSFTEVKNSLDVLALSIHDYLEAQQ